jgi:SAM-dependent methyltransferase
VSHSENQLVPPSCRFCGASVDAVFADLGSSPLANSYLSPEQVLRPETFYPLRVLVCEKCLLVQLAEFVRPEEIFSDYAYFSSYSTTWLAHSRAYVDAVVPRLGLDESSYVIEIASNDGYLLQYLHARGIPVLGIEPAANVAKVALQKGIPTLVEFFGTESAEALVENAQADLLIGNNVLAHVPDMNDFIAGLKILLAPSGVLTMEFPYLKRLMDERQFDTIYHEHFSYFTVEMARRVFASHGLRLFDVEELATHGGSLRIYACHEECGRHEQSSRVDELIASEHDAHLDEVEPYLRFAEAVRVAKRDILEFFIDLKRTDTRIAGYGAPAKGNTLLNYCGIGTDFIDFTVDLNPTKQGLFMPGSHIPILAPEVIAGEQPDLVVILPWNLRAEIMEQLSFVREWGGRFVARAPDMRVFE